MVEPTSISCDSVSLLTRDNLCTNFAGEPLFGEQVNALAAPGRQMDFTGPQGRILAMLIAMMDEWYAIDGSVRQKDSARHGKAKGIVVGGVPFGAHRPRLNGRSCPLEPSPFGVWILPDGSLTEGTQDTCPVSGAVWRGYYEAATLVLQLYAKNRYGRRKIAQLVNSEGFYFRDAKGMPRAFDQENVRQITANWPEYGGVVLGKKAKNRNAREITPGTVTLNAERAIMDIDLCYRVGQVRVERYRERNRAKIGNVRLDAHVFPLSRITFCAHCDNDGTRTYLTGYNGDIGPRYRHSDRTHRCSAHNRTVKADTLEGEFARLVCALSVKPEAVPVLAEYFSKANDRARAQDKRAEALAEIALCKQRIENAEKLFMMARLDEATLKQHVDDNERQIVRIQAELSEEGRIRDMLEMAVQMLSDINTNWEQATNEDKQDFAKNMFSEIVFDLDTRRITGFKLKPWAEPYLQVRVGTAMLPEGSSVQAVRWRSSVDAESLVLQCTQRTPSTRKRVSRNHLSKAERNAEIVRRYQEGEITGGLAQDHGISDRRIRAIIQRYG